MPGLIFHLWSHEDRARARQSVMRFLEHAPGGSRIECRDPQRSLEQNNRMWAMLTDIAEQKTLQGKKWDTDQWKCIFLKALGKETELVPSLEGTWIPYWQSSSRLSRGEMAQLLELITAWGTENGVVWSGPEEETS